MSNKYSVKKANTPEELEAVLNGMVDTDEIQEYLSEIFQDNTGRYVVVIERNEY